MPYDTVESRLTGLLSKDNPYLAQARASAQRQAASRGLQNTTMAATAGESAAISHALPIAQQDAGFLQQRHLQDQQTQQQAHLYGVQGGISSQLQHQAAQQQAGLYGVQGAISSQLAAQDANYRQQLQTNQQQWDAISLQAKLDLDYERLGADKKLKIDERFDKINSDHQRDMLEIYMNPHFKTQADRDKALADLNRLTELRVQTMATLYSVELVWEPPGETVAPTKPEETKTEEVKTEEKPKGDQFGPGGGP
jgi:hypothetical protein